MTTEQARKIDKCVTKIEKCVSLGPPWDQAGWEALRRDIDDEIEARKARITELRRVRKIVQDNIDNFRPFPKKLMERLTAA